MADAVVHVELDVLGVTENKVQVVEAPAYESIFMLGVHAAGTNTVAVPPRAIA
jgi:hypothetical protein